MQLYAGTSALFVEDTFQNRIAEKLRESFFHHFRYHPPASEVHSWQNSLRAMSSVLEHARLDDHQFSLVGWTVGIEPTIS